MTAQEFKKRLQRKNRNIRFYPGPNRGSGLYIRHRVPEDPEQVGLKFLCGVPSPRWNGTLPKLNTIDKDGKWVRGLKSITRVLAKMRINGKKLFDTQFLNSKICPGFMLGDCGPTPQEQNHIQQYHETRRDHVKRLESLGGRVSQVQQMGTELGVLS